ncbi:MAG: hypothetical protein PQJ50_18410, partial [Spirochaetales bacterium]|nr:hypothetical protein [Spirochaetales bacterium]
MKHISAFCLLLFFIGVSLNAIGFNLINLPAVNGIYEVEEEVLFLMDEEWHLENYYPDQYWDFELTKEEYT